MQTSNKLMALVLTAIVGLQLWTLRHQANLEQQIQRLADSMQNSEARLSNDLTGIYHSLREMSEAEQWVRIREVGASSNSSCDSFRSRIEWDLQQWAPQSSTRLLYRSGPDQAWQEARVESLGGQSYAATLSFAGKPWLNAGIVMEYSEGRKSTSHAQDRKPPNTQNYQYQIVAEGPSLSRSTGARSLTEPGRLMIPAKFTLRHEEGGRYRAELVTDGTEQNPCNRVEQAEIRAYIGESLDSTFPLTAARDYRMESQWQSEKRFSRMTLAVRHGGGEEEIELPLTPPQ